MRDVSRLRARIGLALGWLPTVALVSCVEGEAEHARVVRAGLGQPAPPPPAERPTPPDRAAEHDAEERERCPHGLWCAPSADAAMFGIPGDALVDGCPPRIHGNPTNGADPMDPRFKDLSLNMYMKGELVPAPGRGFESEPEDWCCFDWVVDCVGRPVLHEGRQVVPAPRLGPRVASTDRRHRRAGALWAKDAGEELASVAAFARTTLELLALGAPPGLIAACQRAALDELHHASASYAVATELLGQVCRPGPVPAVPARVPDLHRLVRDTFIEGCVAETNAALLAARAVPGCRHERARSVLARIGEDESAHAALAWRILAWALSRAPRAADVLRPLLERPPRRRREGEGDLADLGRPDAVTVAAAHDDAWTQIIAPTLRRLLDGADASREAPA